MLDPDTRRLVGILDWSDAALGDPASDLVGFWLWKGEAFVRRVLESRPLPAEEQWIERARFSVRYAALLDVARAHQLGDAALVETERRWLLEAFEPHECGSARLTSA